MYKIKPKKMILELEFKLMVGTIEYHDVETGYWALNDGERTYRIVEPPSGLKKKGIKIASISQILETEDSIYVTTLNIKIIEYKIL
jgi:hypothetical protein